MPDSLLYNGLHIPMIKALLLTTGLILSSLVTAGTPGEVEVGSVLREAVLHDFDGGTSKLSDYRGKPLLINVWASWCGPCRSEMDSLEKLASRYNGKEFNVIGISTDDDRAAAKRFIKLSGVSFKNHLDRKLLLENMLGANTIPLTVLVDADGRVLEKVHGAYEWDSPQVIHAIKKIFDIRPDAEETIKNDPLFGLRILSQN
jgi:thiol-disulfide isomerase/thioredoxin